MATVLLNLQIPNAMQLAAFYDQIIVFRSTAGKSGPYAELTPPQSRLTLFASQTVYPYTDTDGAAGYFYAAGFINSQTGDRSPMGDPVSGAGGQLPGLMTVQQLKDQYLLGLEMRQSDGTPFPDSYFATAIQRATAAFEQRTQVTVLPTPVTGERHDIWRHHRPGDSPRLQTKRVPVQSLQALRIALPYFRTTQPLPLDWVRLTGISGRIVIYPQGPVPGFDPLGSQASYARRGWDEEVVPNGWVVDYVAGFPPGEVPPDILDAVAKMACIEPLRVAGDLFLGPGIISQSLGIDGLSQGTGTTKTSQGGAYQSRIAAYQQDLANPDFGLAAIRRNYRGLLYRPGTS